CPQCGGKARRETDVSDTFLDSAWYFFRYLDHQNKKQPFSKKIAKRWLPVHAYIGGAEHAVLHLLYSRFITMVFKDMGLISFNEPYSKFRAHGLLISEGAKMSKSKGNVVIPDAYIKKFGADVVRTYLMFIGPFEQGGDWRDAGIMGPVRFLNRVWDLGVKQETKDPGSRAKLTTEQISPWFHASIKEITEDTAELKYNTAISHLMTILNKLEKEPQVNRKDWESFLLMLAPFAPFITEELWEKLGNSDANSGRSSDRKRRSKYSIHNQSWPKYDVKHLVRDTFTLVIQVNGKLRAQVAANRGIVQKEAEKLALANPRIQKFISDKKIRKIIFVKDRLINFVV
ncbi:MAG: class I tRNA ligase family protein, partial [Candidatus Colwellbacteria bacterium]|nr:class I tRNA ligase family protein [Candidatus Colwellbacteria bacterium]